MTNNRNFVKYVPRNFDWGEYQDWNLHVKTQIKRHQTCQAVTVGLNKNEELVGWVIEWE